MAKKRAKKKARAKKVSAVKSVFLYGEPNKGKRNELRKINDLFTAKVNEFIRILCNNTEYLKEVLLSQNKSGCIGELEKKNRSNIGSAYGQQAIGYAMVKASQYEKSVHRQVRAWCKKGNERAIAGSTFLYVSILQGKSRDAIMREFAEFITKEAEARDNLNAQLSKATDDETIKALKLKLKPITEKLTYHTEMLALMNRVGVEEYNNIVELIRIYHDDAVLATKIPTVRRCEVQLDSRLFTLEDPETVKADKVISIKGATNRQRIVVPVTGSSEGLRRLMHYDIKHAATFTITKNGKLKVAVQFEKKLIEKPWNDYVGVDIGIADYIHSSKFGAFGTAKKSDEFYSKQVEPALGKKNTLRNTMRAYSKKLHKEKDLPEYYKDFLRRRINHINRMLQIEKKSVCLLNQFHTLQEKDIKDAVTQYVTEVRKNPCCTVLEMLDIDEFDDCKSLNRKRSMWARAKLTDKLMDMLEWYGYPFLQVEPAYTSKACPICHHIDDDNRKGKNFKCTCCGHKDDADHNASVNIKARATDGELAKVVAENKDNTDERHAAIRDLYAKRHADWLLHPSSVS